jgi:hypothetical protein
MTKLEELQNDLTYHIASRKGLLEKKGKSYRLLLQSGFPIEGVIASHDKIISDLEREIAFIKSKKALRKQAQKTSNKKKAAK